MGYFDLDAAGCKEETASGVVDVVGSDLRGVIGKHQDVKLVRPGRGEQDRLPRAVVLRKY